MCLSRRVEGEIGEKYFEIVNRYDSFFRFSHVISFLFCNFLLKVWLNFFLKCLRTVKKAGVTPFVVFDGLSLAAEEGENGRRRRWEKFSSISKCKLMSLFFSTIT